jgi:hypothetical protein
VILTLQKAKEILQIFGQRRAKLHAPAGSHMIDHQFLGM